MPGTEVEIARKGPPVSVLGLGSQLSSWLTPPCMKMLRIRLCLVLIWSARAGELAKVPARPAAADAPRNDLRERMWSSEWQAYGQRMGATSDWVVIGSYCK